MSDQSDKWDSPMPDVVAAAPSGDAAGAESQSEVIVLAERTEPAEESWQADLSDRIVD